MSIDSYLFFNGNCEEAMNFYAASFKGEVTSINKFSEGPMEIPEDAGDRVMHGTVQIGTTTLMFSDTMPDQEAIAGNSMSLSFNCDSPEQQDAFFDALTEEGTVVMPLEETFWGARFGMAVDKFGVSWMFNYHAPQK